jgi:hypothetical protein
MKLQLIAAEAFGVNGELGALVYVACAHTHINKSLKVKRDYFRNSENFNIY